MTTKQIIELFSKNEPKSCAPSTEVVSELMRHTDLTYAIDESGIDYVCKVSVSALSKAPFKKETLDLMLNEGWTVSKDRKFIQLLS